MATNPLYAGKFENFQKTLDRQEADYVPTLMNDGGGSMLWTGKTVFDVLHDPQLFAEAVTKVLDEMWVDVNVIAGATTTPAIGKAFPGAETQYAPDGTLTHLQSSPMKADEYDQLIADPAAFVANVMLPRKHPYLYENRDSAKDALKIYAEQSVYGMLNVGGVTQKLLEEKYGVYSFVSPVIVNTPLDHIFDFFRGFRGTLTDLRRQPDKVKAAMDAIWEYRWAEKIKTPMELNGKSTFQPCHIPAYLSPKQFDELYWPYEKQLIEWIAASGGRAMIYLEGRWEKFLHYFLELPKDCCILAVDDDDFLKVHDAIGHHQILCGGLKSADVRLKKFEDIKDDVKRVIDICAPGGGFIFSTDKLWLAPGDVNPTLIEAYNFAHEYSSK